MTDILSKKNDDLWRVLQKNVTTEWYSKFYKLIVQSCILEFTFLKHSELTLLCIIQTNNKNLPFIYFLENVFESTIIPLKNRVLRTKKIFKSALYY